MPLIRFASSVLLVFALTACEIPETDKYEFQQPELAANQVATIERPFGVWVWRIDEQYWPHTLQSLHIKIKVLPGPHSLHFRYHTLMFDRTPEAFKVLNATGAAYINFEAKAGQNYQLASSWSGNVHRTWLSEAESGRVLGAISEKYEGAKDSARKAAPQPLFPKHAISDGRNYNTIAIRFLEYENIEEWSEPLKGEKAASRGAARGVEEAFHILCSPGSGIGCIVFSPVIALVGATVGAGVGGGMSHSDEEVVDATASLKNLMIGENPDKILAEAVSAHLQEARSRHYNVHTLSEDELTLSNAELAEKGIDAVLELEVTSLEVIVPPNSIDPDAQYFLGTRSRLIDTRSDVTSLAQSWIFASSPYDYFELAAEDAQRLAQLIEQSYSEISDLIVSDLFE